MDPEVKLAITDEQILSCWDVLHLLRPDVTREEFLGRIKVQQGEGYGLAYIQDPTTKSVISVMGFREFTMLFYGRAMYVEDLVTVPEFRGRGLASALVTWFKDRARSIGQKYVATSTLPSDYVMLKFFVDRGFHFDAHHFGLNNLLAQKV